MCRKLVQHMSVSAQQKYSDKGEQATDSLDRNRSHAQKDQKSRPRFARLISTGRWRAGLDGAVDVAHFHAVRRDDKGEAAIAAAASLGGVDVLPHQARC